MRAKELLTENTLDTTKIAEIAQRMLNRYRGLSYTARERAVDHAFGYDRNQPQHQYWLAVADEISRLEKNDKGVAEGSLNEVSSDWIERNRAQSKIVNLIKSKESWLDFDINDINELKKLVKITGRAETIYGQGTAGDILDKMIHYYRLNQAKSGQMPPFTGVATTATDMAKQIAIQTNGTYDRRFGRTWITGYGQRYKDPSDYIEYRTKDDYDSAWQWLESKGKKVYYYDNFKHLNTAIKIGKYIVEPASVTRGAFSDNPETTHAVSVRSAATINQSVRRQADISDQQAQALKDIAATKNQNAIEGIKRILSVLRGEQDIKNIIDNSKKIDPRDKAKLDAIIAGAKNFNEPDSGISEDTVNEFAISGDDDSGPQRPMSLADVAKIIKAKLGPGWTMEHVGRTEQPGYKFIPTDKTKHGMAKIWCLVDWDKVGEYPTYNTILYSFQNENGRLIANGRHTEKAKPKTVSNALMTAQSILGNTDGALKGSMAEDTVDEMALASYKTLGDFSKPGSFRGVDKRLVPHPKSELKAAKFFEQTPYDFRLFFANKPGLRKYQEHGPMTPDQIVKVFGEEDAKKILENHDDSITVVYVSNRGDEKVMMTPWIMAHRFGHAVYAGARRDKWSAWMETEKLFFSTVNRLLDEYYGKVGSVFNFRKADQPYWNLTPEYNALFNAIGTQRSSRTGQIRRPYEFMYELFAQYLGTGTITLNPLPTNLGYGRKVFGNPSKYLNIKPEFRDETERRQISEMLARDMELMFNDVLGNSVGKIFVM